MGIFLIIWTWKYRDKEGLKNTSILIAASFLFYIPVVVGACFIPELGAFMIPKTIAYVLLVVTGFKFFIKDFSPENILKNSAVFLFMGLVGGVFYREFINIFPWGEFTTLSIVHVHLIALGLITLFVIYVLMQSERERIEEIKIPLTVYITGLTWTVASFLVRGIYSITSSKSELFPDAALSGIAGIGHVLLGVGMVCLILKIISIKTYIEGAENEQ
ncbi:DUF2871 domain-containing protein [Peptoniphilus sp. KCTC 25270]|uniref:DUF2871 family protein n=1 Tax=Peptoniphilus sp. KCTC 25270 TaxID=2897414 RepID=UPI001E5D4E5B|nr:DUF2871 family protein [Peptoniphilus sp. KCTC 25270]MCD1146546.1 DUF2871 domain-containing protein [Peptoniphilus sp. KCTC 25270]